MLLTLPPEMTTAVTDFIVGLFAFTVFILLQKHKKEGHVKNPLWLWVMAVLAIASVYGTFAHAIVMDTKTLDLFWMPLSFMLGMMVSLFAASVTVEYSGLKAVKKSLTVFLPLGLMFFVIMTVLQQFIAGYFIVFVLYSALMMLYSLVVCVLHALKNKSASGLYLALGILVMIVGSVLQAMRSIFFTVIWLFDYNSVYHFAVMLALVLLYVGIKKSKL